MSRRKRDPAGNLIPKKKRNYPSFVEEARKEWRKHEAKEAEEKERRRQWEESPERKAMDPAARALADEIATLKGMATPKAPDYEARRRQALANFNAKYAPYGYAPYLLLIPFGLIPIIYIGWAMDGGWLLMLQLGLTLVAIIALPAVLWAALLAAIHKQREEKHGPAETEEFIKRMRALNKREY